MLPTRDIYENVLRPLFNARGNGSGPYLTRSWDDLRREYEDLRREYEDLRYTFNPQQGVTDVWEVPICGGAERVKVNGQTAHVAQKPLAIMRRIIEASSNEGDTIIEPFAGTGTACVAAAELGRHFIGIELNPEYVAIAEARIAAALRRPSLWRPPSERTRHSHAARHRMGGRLAPCLRPDLLGGGDHVDPRSRLGDG